MDWGSGLQQRPNGAAGHQHVAGVVGRAVWVRNGDVTGALKAGNVVQAARSLSDRFAVPNQRRNDQRRKLPAVAHKR